MKPCRLLLLQLLVVSHLTILRFLRLELVNQYFDRRHSTVVYHFHTHWPDWLPGSCRSVSFVCKCAVCCKCCCTNEHGCHCCYNYQIFCIHSDSREESFIYLHYADSDAFINLIFFLLERRAHCHMYYFVGIKTGICPANSYGMMELVNLTSSELTCLRSLVETMTSFFNLYKL